MPRKTLSSLIAFLLIASTSAFAAETKKPSARKGAAKLALPKGAVMMQNVVIPGCDNAGTIELTDPTLLTPTDHVLDTKFDVALGDMQVPVLKSDGTCRDSTFSLRLYRDPKSGQLAYPGPTLRVHRATDSAPGDRIRVLLQNHLPPNSPEGCVWAGAGKELCDCTVPVNPPPGYTKPRCCGNTTKPQGMDCFHGSNDTNLHFHGTHASPQSPQDFVLLTLQPYGSTVSDINMPMGHMENVQQGSFQYDVNPLPANQAEGTHWYHPHKHGSTAEQVGEGMAGALIVDGPFDTWLNGQFSTPLREKLMVIQTIHDLNFTSTARKGTPMPLINGILTPKITMNPGEVQRWRLIGATMEAAAQLEIDFNGLVPGNTIQARQIAMDGVQFSPKNYACQPLFVHQNPVDTCSPVTDYKFQLSPGNRADFLIKAPADKAGQDFLVPYEVFGLVERQGQTPKRRNGTALTRVLREETRAALDALAPGDAQPALLKVHICDPAAEPGCKAVSMDFPAQWPNLPAFLPPIQPNRSPQNVQLQILKTAGVPAPDGFFAVQMNVNGSLKTLQFDEDCANFTEPLDANGGEEWHVSQNLNNNGGKPLHVFHIHTNPFQVVGIETRQPDGSYKITTRYPEPIWQDSITLPNNATAGDANTAGTRVVLRQRFEDYTGPYVFHCHFLGHEDRGMMLTVQTVCPQNGQWSQTSTSQQECTSGQFVKPLPPCGTTTLTSSKKKHTH